MLLCKYVDNISFNVKLVIYLDYVYDHRLMTNVIHKQTLKNLRLQSMIYLATGM